MLSITVFCNVRLGQQRGQGQHFMAMAWPILTLTLYQEPYQDVTMAWPILTLTLYQVLYQDVPMACSILTLILSQVLYQDAAIYPVNQLTMFCATMPI